MALKIARATGNLSAAATFGSVVGALSFANNVSIDTSTSAFYSATFTAANTSDPIYGVYIPFLYLTSTGGKAFDVVLQEDTTGGGTWADTAATVNYAPTVDYGGRGVYFSFGSSYTPTTTGANRYRVRLQNTVAGSSLLRIYGANTTNFSVYAVYGSSAPASGDPVWILGDRENAYNITIDVDTTIGNFGSTTAPMAYAVAAASGGADLVIEAAGKLSWDRTAYRTLTVRGMIWFGQGVSGGLDAGTAADPLDNGGKLIIAQNGTSTNYGIQKTGSLTTNGCTIKTYGVDVSTHWTTYVSGNGATGTEFTTAADIGAVGDEVFITGTNATQQGEYKFLKTKPTATTATLSTTSGGAEAALSYTHTTNARVLNLTRGFTITSDDNTKSWYYYGQDNTPGAVLFYNTRLENLGGGAPYKFGITIGYVNAAQAVFSKCVFYRCITAYLMYLNDTAETTWADNIWVGRNVGSAFNAAGAWANKNFDGDNFICDFASSGVILAGSNFTADRLEIWGCNNAASGVHAGIRGIGFYGCTINTLVVNDCRIQAIYASGTDGLRFYNGHIGDYRTNAINVTGVTGTTNEMLFENCDFGSDTLVSGYTNMNAGSEIKFQKIAGSDTNHKWYTKYGVAQTETSTVRTGDLSLAIKPESSTTGFTWEFTVPANPNQQIFIPGYFYRSAGLTGTVTIEIFLPYSTTADETVTFGTATGSWQPLTISQDYTGTVPLLATVRINVKGTAGNTIYLDDFFNSGNTSVVNNNIASFETWYQGKPAPIFSLLDVSAIPGQTRQEVWSDSNTYTAGQKGKVLADTEANTDVTQAKVDQL